MPDFGFNWRYFTLDGTRYRHRMEDGNYEVERWVSFEVREESTMGCWVTCKHPIGAPELGY